MLNDCAVRFCVYGKARIDVKWNVKVKDRRFVTRHDGDLPLGLMYSTCLQLWM